MKLNPEDEKAGLRWLFVAGPLAVLLSFGLMKIDDFLSNSTREKELGRTLHELRLAQTSLSSGGSDERQDVLSASSLKGEDRDQDHTEIHHEVHNTGD